MSPPGESTETSEVKKRGRKPGSPNKPKLPESMLPEPRLGSSQERRETNLKRLVKKGPYKTKGEEWKALEAIIRIQRLRETRGLQRLNERLVEEWTGFTPEQIIQSLLNPEFRKFREAMAKSDMGQALVDASPTLKFALDKMADDVRENPNDEKRREKFLSLYTNIMEKYGIMDIDISAADVREEWDVDEAFKMAQEIIENLTGVLVPEQKISRLVIDGLIKGPDEQTEVRKADGDIRPPEDGPPAGPDPVVPPIHAPTDAHIQ